jgi:hypothetical protein
VSFKKAKGKELLEEERAKLEEAAATKVLSIQLNPSLSNNSIF